MRTLRSSFFCLQPPTVALLTALSLFTTVSVQAGWQLAWNDEFDGTAVDPAKWTFDIGNGTDGWGNWEREFYTSRTNNAYVADGALHIVARQESYGGFPYTSARMKTQDRFSKTYGRFEFRARLPQGLGFWPALWMLGTNITSVGWPACGEIDVMENRGSSSNQVGGALHYSDPSNNNHLQQAQTYTVATSVTNFHTFAVEWATNSIKWIVDGTLVQTWTSWSSSTGPYPAPFNQPFFVIMNLAIGGGYLGYPSDAEIDANTVFPGEMQVDYVRVYEYVPSAPDAPTGLTAHAGNEEVFLSWDEPIGATGYNVKRATNSGGPYTLIASPAGTSYVDTGLSACSSYYYVVSATNSLGESTNSSEAAVTLGVFTLAVNSGGSAAAQFGTDSGFSGGTQPAPVTAVIDTSGAVAPAPQAVYQTERYGDFSYTLTGLPPGLDYQVRLHFAETYWTAAGQRVFNVSINGTQVLNNFDIIAAAGAPNRPTIQEFTAAANASGEIAIQFTTVTDNAKSSGIEILLPEPPPPADVTAKAGNSHVTLYWSPSLGAATYDVKRSLASGGSYTPVASGLTNTCYTDHGLANGITNYYVVSAVNTGCESMDSAAASATPHLGWGNALSFDGTNGYVQSQQNIDLAHQSFTLEAWARRTNTGSIDMILGQGSAGTGQGLHFGFHCCQWVNKFCFGFYADDLFTTSVYTDNEWHHWAATYDASTLGRSIYRDGVLVGTNTAQAHYQGSGPLYVGKLPFGSTSTFPGTIDEVRVWNKARSQAEIVADISRPLTGSEPNLVAYWNFNEPSGNTAYDSTINGHDGTLMNGPVWTNSTIPPFVNLNASLPGVWASSVTWGDYDNDGWLDFLLTGWSGSSDIAQVWRNTGNGFTNVTATVAPGLPGVSGSSVAWGDYDNDERLDILLTGSTSSGLISQVWRNTGSGFTNVPIPGLTGVLGVKWSSVAWGDYDNDGRLDILLTGETGSSRIAQVWRNTGSGFTNLNVGLPGVHYGSVAWGDYDNDGWLDFLLTGWSGSSDIAQVWRNTGNGFSNVTATVAPGLPGVSGSSVAWGDYDNDGRLDILLTGSTSSGLISQVWRNTGSGFVNLNAGLPGVRYSSVAWGDYDNDGLLDILLTGQTGSGLIAQLWRNTGSGFVNLNAGLPGVRYSSAAWGDYDNDGRLDILLTGLTGSSIIAQVWRNNSPVANTPPTAPADLATSVMPGTASLSWSAAADAQTPTNGLTYNLRAGTAPGGSDVVSPHAESTSGLRRVPALGNVQHGLTAVLTKLPAGTCYWSVQAVDPAFAGSPFATEGSFVVVTAPQVTTLPASDVVVAGTNACVTLNGTVNPGGLTATAWFEWGATTAYGNLTPAFPLGDTNIALPVTHWLCGLAAGTTNHVRLVATNTAGLTAGDDVVFITQLENLAQNPGFEDGTDPWFGFGAALTTSTNAAHSGTYSGLVTNRTAEWNGVAQTLLGVLQTNRLYRISAWVRLADGDPQTVALTVAKTDGGETTYEWVAGGTATSTGWTQLSGSYTLTVSGELTDLLLYLEVPTSPTVSFYADDFVIEAYDWKATANAGIEMFRKRDMRLLIEDGAGNPVPGATVEVRQTRRRFAFGSEINYNIGNPAYAAFFRTNFEWAVMGNESKWYANEPTRSNVTYAVADGITNYCYTNGITLRGHCIFWAVDDMVQSWVKALSDADLRVHLTNRLDSAVNHFKGTFVHWDVNNEMLHGNYFGNRLGNWVNPWMFQYAHALDPEVKLFVNDYNVLSWNETDAYKQQIQDLLAEGAPVQAIGAQGHFGDVVDPVATESRLDSLAELGLPIWITEYDSVNTNESVRADNLETVYRLAFSKPAVDGVLMWGFWAGSHWRGSNAAIVDLDWKLNAAGQRYRSLMDEWTTTTNGTSGAGGAFEFRGIHGTYEVTLTPPGGEPTLRTITVEPGEGTSVLTLALDAPPVAGPASNPNPADGVYDVALTPTLTWSTGSYATSHRVFFGYSSNAVAIATTNSTEYQGELAVATFAPGTLASSGRYYWRVDEMLGTNATAGATWTFATAVNPNSRPPLSAGLGGGDTLQITFPSQLGQTYRVEWTDSLSPASWLAVADNLPGTGDAISVPDPGVATQTQRFYRALILPP